MTTEEAISCVEPAKGPIQNEGVKSPPIQAETQKEKSKMKPLVGNPAPDFEASAYFDGGFKNVKLSDYKGQWILLCFYPGDFTFV